MSKDLQESMENMEQRVLLLALYKRKEDETFKDVLLIMEGTGVFTKKEGKKYMKNLKALNYITDEGFTMIGLEKAKEVELEFKI